jgi:hypothetical protein
LSTDLFSLDPKRIRGLGDAEFRGVLSQLIQMQQHDRQENQLLYYKPVSAEAEKIHLTGAKTVAVGGGNGSSKTETCLVEMAMLCTGIVPLSLQGQIKPEEKLRGPVHCRVVCESLTTVLHPIILPKLKWWQWTGIDKPGGERGHWGWIPQHHLVKGSWDKSWSEKLRVLRIVYRNPETGEPAGESTIQFCSHDQDPSDFASGDFDMVLHDEPPNLAIWRENEARTMRVNGRMFLAMTWPDDPSIPVDWIFDEVYEPAMGSGKNPNIDWINLYTTDNPHLDQEAIAVQSEKWSEETRQVRIYGRPIRFSNRVHPLFTDQTQWWCFACGKAVLPIEGACSCSSRNIVAFNHVEGFAPERWPAAFLLDPHPRKPHMFMWVHCSPQDDLWQIAEGEIDGDPSDVKVHVDEVERRLGRLRHGAAR